LAEWGLLVMDCYFGWVLADCEIPWVFVLLASLICFDGFGLWRLLGIYGLIFFMVFLAVSWGFDWCFSRGVVLGFGWLKF
jgi:hypothetical protein